jgi:hypothetical protein
MVSKRDARQFMCEEGAEGVFFNPLDPPFLGEEQMGAEGHPRTPGRSFSCTSVRLLGRVEQG